MALAPFEAIVVKKVGESGSDGTTDNDERTLPVYVGGQNFSIILVDSVGVQADVKVQVNNAEFTVHFDHAASSIPFERYQNVFGDRIVFDSDWCGVAFDKALLRLPFTQADPGLNAMMDRQAAVLLEMFDSKLNLVNSTREQVASRLPNGDPILDDVAEALSLTARVLQNRLKESGTTFKEVVDDVRKQLALSYLSEEDVPLIDVAFLLGFSEQSSFSRAFKRWMGKSPMEYRKMS